MVLTLDDDRNYHMPRVIDTLEPQLAISPCYRGIRTSELVCPLIVNVCRKAPDQICEFAQFTETRVYSSGSSKPVVRCLDIDPKVVMIGIYDLDSQPLCLRPLLGHRSNLHFA